MIDAHVFVGQSLYENSLDSVYIIGFDGNFIDANPAALKLSGFSKEEIPKVRLGTKSDDSPFAETTKILKI